MNHFYSKVQFYILLLILPLSLSAQNYTILGHAVQQGSCDCYRFTQDANNQGGAIFQDQTINLNNSFDFTFSIFLGCNNGNGADGLMFVLTTNPNGLGQSGGGMGYAGSTQPNSLAVEFDTYENTSSGDIAAHHIGVNSGGLVNHNVVPPTPALPNSANIDDCQNHTVRIVWDVNSNTYSVYFDGNLRVSLVIPDIANTYFNGNPIVNWGWTGATGGSTNEHRVCVESTSNWVAGVNYQSCSQTIQFTDVSTSNVGTIQSWDWDFGDGTTSSQQNPIHTYASTGTYNVSLTIIDINGCDNTYANPVTIADSIVLSATLNEPPCNGGSNGGIIADATLGFGPAAGYGGYSYNWSNGRNSFDNSGITSGTYVVTVTDGVCNTVEEYTLNQPSPLTATTSATDASCGASDGTVSIVISGGTPPYQNVSWAGLPGATRTGLSPNTYIADFEDFNGCSALLQYTATVADLPCGISSSINKTDVNCLGGNDGTISIIVNGGTAPANISWGHGASGFILNNLTAGTYTYNYSDANPANNFSGTVEILEPPVAIQGQLSVANTSCAGSNDGSAIASVTAGGNPPYTYNWSGGHPNNAVLNNLAAGPISLTIVDNLGCEISFSDNITGPPVLTLTIDAVDDSCYQSGKGNALANVTGGNPPYTYYWDNISSGQNNIGLRAGNYAITVTDNKNCTVTGSTIIGEAAAISYTANTQNVNCNGDATGSIEISNISGGTPAYSYTWSPPTLSGNNPTGLSSDTYYLSVSDLHNCTSLDTFQISEPDSALNITSSYTNATCNGADDGSIDLSIWGGTAPFSFMGNQIPSRSLKLENLAPGVYGGQLVDANGCTFNVSETISEPDPIVINENHNDASCFGASNGDINITASGGTMPYSFEWNDGILTQNRTGLSAGTYSVTLTDSNSCTESLSILISEPAAIPLDLSTTDARCYGDSGTASALPSEGSAPYTFNWSGSNSILANVNLLNGNHSVTSTSSEGCVQTANLTINSANQILIQESHTDNDCFGDAEGSISLNVSGGAGNFSYTWQPNISSNNSASQLPEGIYDILVTDQNNCTENISIQISANPLLEAVASATDETCFGEEDGTIETITTGGQAPYSYAATSSSETLHSSTGLFSNLPPGNYTIDLIDANNCTATTAANISSAEAIVASATSQSISCAGDSDASISVQVNGGAAPFSYLWNDGVSSQTREQLSPGVYSVSITDANGCVSTLSETIENAEEIWVKTDSLLYEINIGGTAEVKSQTFTDAKQVISYNWQPTKNIDCADCPNVNIQAIESGSYTLSIVDEAGCTASTKFEIVVNNEHIFYAPNAFTPDGDGINDEFGIETVGVESFRLRIFNRWGTLVFETYDIKELWDGSYKGEILSPDVFVYSVEIKYLDQTDLLRKGSLTLIR